MNQKPKKNNPKDSAWYFTARGIAWVSGIFSLIVAGLLILNYMAAWSGLPEKEVLYSAKLAEKKASLIENPRDEELRKEIRSLDLEMRKDYFQRRTFSRRGCYLLLVGVAVFVLAMKKTAAMQKIKPKPKSQPKDSDLEARNRMKARRVVGVLGLVLLAGVLSLASIPRIELPVISSETPELAEESVPPTVKYPTDEEIQENWPVFRGPGGLGVSAFERVPASWDEKSGEGILWKAEVLLPGYNSPVIWGDRVFISGADEKSKEVFCYSTESGELLWRRRVENIPGNVAEVKVYDYTGYAASTMACDGARVYAIFADGDLICFDLDGQRVWAKNMGVPDSVYSYATSLTFYRNLLLIQYDQGEDDDNLSVLYALEGKTGGIVWQATRPVANSWTSPILIDTGEGKQLVTCSEPWVIGYEPSTGEELWRANLLGTDLAPSPIYAQGLVFVIQPNETLFALRTDGRGDVTETHVAWTVDCFAPDIPSPASNGELIFLLTSLGILTCYETQTGEMCWEHRFDDTFAASPSVAGDWLYLLSEEGAMYRVKAAREFEEGITSHLDDRISASPAFMDGRIYIRGDKHLYCLGNK
ncbi:MAG: PQQ-binding-like beta-propeller repeat protein [bacterium]